MALWSVLSNNIALRWRIFSYEAEGRGQRNPRLGGYIFAYNLAKRQICIILYTIHIQLWNFFVLVFQTGNFNQYFLSYPFFFSSLFFAFRVFFFFALKENYLNGLEVEQTTNYRPNKLFPMTLTSQAPYLRYGRFRSSSHPAWRNGWVGGSSG